VPKPTQRSSGGNTYAGQNEFVRWTMSESTKPLLKAYDMSPETALDLVEELNQQGYRIALKYDAYDKCASALLIGTEECEVNSGRTLTGRGSTAYKALKCVLYAHYQVFSEVWPANDVIRREELDD